METTKAIITIALADGSVKQHPYDIEKEESKLLAWAMFYSHQISEVLRLRTKHAFVVMDPLTAYNREHIQSVSIEFIDPEIYANYIESWTPDEFGFRPQT